MTFYVKVDDLMESMEDMKALSRIEMRSRQAEATNEDDMEALAFFHDVMCHAVDSVKQVIDKIPQYMLSDKSVKSVEWLETPESIAEFFSSLDKKEDYN